mmetsp:Transcript_4443/g.6408  ORF Transcript_4443/g.6408 Transcript_4443/m.6408 type:complete len:498 (+) Transcript_4443:68-1561(+)|eukprot:CAMPEP_0194224654 /NCGR_PEP_ID=MMETSP0156-20130528/37983_1 /TAXON_ID=33649 /ORGANISM="Thalassionema nitzschioides, Strain L26-B" /LENGTH=497 /DNA_ID=CAMNT_0038956329 /DNA_START=48 /DNA_END=1541 /DNA_ORIENTATION=-
MTSQDSSSFSDDEPQSGLETRTFEIMTPSEHTISTEDTIEATNNALLRSLKCAGVQFLRYVTLDPYNNTRSKAVPLKRLIKSNSTKNKLENQVSIAEVCYGGLPSHADILVPGTTVDARRVLAIKPDLNTLRILPYSKKTALVIGNVYDPSVNMISKFCTRGLLARVLETAEAEHGILFQVGAELEFNLVLDNGNLGENDVPQTVDYSVFANTATLNEQEDFISEVYNQLEEQDIEVELIHAESGNGQLELVLQHQSNVMKLADDILLARDTIRSVARAHQLRALFLPKINPMQAGNGLHLHFSFRDLDSRDPQENAFPGHDDELGLISRKGAAFLEGILYHLPPLLALTIPSVNSFRRVGEGCWTGHTISWNAEDKESPLRVCLDLETGEATNVEYKLSDSVANIYLALAAILSSGLDGMVRQLELRPSSEKESEIVPLPDSFAESLKCLERSKFFRSVLGDELITNYLAVRYVEEQLNQSSDNIQSEVISAYNKA